MTDVKANIVAWARYFCEKHKANFIYSEGPQRMSALGHFPVQFPVFADCSAFVTLCYWLGGAADPNGGTAYNATGFGREGYTGTLLSHGTHIPVAEVQPGDVVVYGPGTGWHTALVTDVTPNGIRTISHGQQGDPSYVWVNGPNNPHDGREPQTFLRFNTNALNPSAIHTPPAE